MEPLPRIVWPDVSSTDEELPFAGEYLDFAELGRDELQAKVFELLTLVETSRDLLRAEDASDVARRVLLSAIGVLGASSASVLLHHPGRGQLELRLQLGLDLDDDFALPLPEEQAKAFTELGPPRPFRLDQPGRLPKPVRHFLRAHQRALAELDATVACPLPGRRGLVGFLVLGRRLLAEGYSPRDLELFASLAELYVLALDRFARLAGTPRREGDDAARRPRKQSPQLTELRRRHAPLGHILGESEAIRALFDDLVEFADSRATVLVQGESGTGKELIARAVHQLSRRKDGPFEVVDCSSIPSELIESELFGHVKGSFTGAVRDRRGAFDLAHGGTIFLDEIGDMNLPSQTRLLRVLQEGKFRPVGGEKTHSVDVRVVAATNVDLREAVREGRFRKDLFYRIQVFPLRLPPLREREGDVAVLFRRFLERFYREFDLEAPSIDDGVLVELGRYHFPGNVRELQNITEALAVRSRSEGCVTREQLHEVFRSMRIGPSELPGEDPPRAPLPDEESPPTPRYFQPDGRSTGQFVVDLWHQSGFNLLEASRQARARRNEGQVVPVVDRAQMSHYLDGEVLRLFVEFGSAQRVGEELGRGHPLRHRAEKRARRVLSELAEAAAARRITAEFPRLPEDYRSVLAELERRGHEWIAARLDG